MFRFLSCARDTRHLRPVLVLFSLLLLFGVPVQSIQAQGSMALPNELYFQALQPYYAGAYRDAASGFREAARNGHIDVNGRWIDSICYHTMIGECLFHMGQLDEAIEQYEAALNLYLANRDWMLRGKFQDSIRPSNSSARNRITWGPSKRRSTIGLFPANTSVLIGRLDNDVVIQRGGVVENPEFRSVNVQEVIRCTALAMRRRREILGPTCAIDLFTIDLLKAASRLSAPPNHWSQAWAQFQLGFAYFAADKPTEATAALQNSLLVEAKFDHPLTSAALLGLGNIAYEQGKYDLAANFFHEATLAGAQFGKYDDMEEAFRYGAIIHMITGKKGVFPPLVEAATWAKRQSSLLRASLFLSLAENFSSQTETARSAAMLDQAQQEMRRTDMSEGAMGARASFQEARVSFQSGNVANGMAALSRTITYQRKGSKRIYQIALADKLYANGEISPRVASKLYEEVLQEPTAKHWTLEPMETLSVAMTPHSGPMEHWFEVALFERKEPERALEIADMIRRHRFYSTLPMGGRLLSLRWILEAPTEALAKRAVLQRQQLLVKFPNYAALSQKVRVANDKLDDIGLKPENEEDSRDQIKQLVELGKLSGTQELILSDIALRRQAADFVFPPQLTLDEVREPLREDQLLLVFFNTQKAVYAFLLSKDDFSYETVSDPVQVRKELVALLRAMGHRDKNLALPKQHFESDAWRDPAAKLFQLLTPKLTSNVLEKFNELVIVPDSLLWYVPFEALQVPQGESTVSLMEKIRIRYAPTLSTAVPDKRAHKRVSKTAAVVGKMFPRDDAEVAEIAFADLQRANPTAVDFSLKLPAPSGLFAATCDRLVVYDEIDGGGGGAYDWSPMQIDRGKPGSALANWISLPWRGPSQTIIPGLHTAAANGLKNGGRGDEIFLAVCGLMASGSRTMLLSRWRTGGQTSFDLTREFVRELPRSTASRAWQRSVQLSLASERDPNQEPRIKSSGLDEAFHSDHPFFWSGYLLVDSGAEPNLDEAELAIELKTVKKKP